MKKHSRVTRNPHVVKNPREKTHSSPEKNTCMSNGENKKCTSKYIYYENNRAVGQKSTVREQKDGPLHGAHTNSSRVLYWICPLCLGPY